MSRRKRTYFTQKGVAMIAVAVCISVVAALTAEFSTNTTTDWIAATNNRDNMRARFHARSAMNLSRLLITLQTNVLDRYREQLASFLPFGPQIGDYAPFLVPFFGGSKKEVSQMAGAMGLPVDPESLKGLGIEHGTFELAVDTEDGKINLNCANGSDDTRKNLKTQLDALFYFQAYDPIFQNADAEGWRRTRAEQVTALIDYIDRDHSKYGVPGTPEQYGYDSLEDPYEAKNNYLDSVGEIKQIRGVDDRFWTLFGGEFTIYGGCKVNVSAVDDPKLVASVILLSAKDPKNPVLRDPKRLWKLAEEVIAARDQGFYFTDLESFAAFVKSPTGALEQLVEKFAGEGAAAQLPQTQQNQPEIQGVALDTGKLKQIATAGARRMYRVEATARIGNVEKRIVGIWDTNTQNQNMRDQAYSQGAWVFWREE